MERGRADSCRHQKAVGLTTSPDDAGRQFEVLAVGTRPVASVSTDIATVHAINNVSVPYGIRQLWSHPSVSEVVPQVEVISRPRRTKACLQRLWSVPRAKAAPGELDHQCV